MNRIAWIKMASDLIGMCIGAMIGWYFTMVVMDRNVNTLRAALIEHNLGEYYSDEPGGVPDKFRLIENDEQEQQ